MPLGNKEIAEMLIASGARINVADYIGRTALHMANQNGNTKTNPCNWKPILEWHWYERNKHDLGYISISELLIEKGANVNFVDDDGKTEIHYTVQNGN